ncbi:DoxX family protein [Leptospira perolatii]|uniref:DoxX family protein n=1 Tax=Leptospira perolatii TaxID=2023191 RepID=A0A2M9ZP06_9LEPT|nr:DoxX family protein [Leptospira perolatii]PJZ70902.1 DoxX family protein [Leptospira perolatii]PJZ73797.1 DoxX family protein [Leptospira perolatii]
MKLESINRNRISLALSLVSAIILLQTLYFKFSGASESVYIFNSLHMEPWGRIGSGIAELIVAVLILLPKFRFLGAIGSIGIMSSALFAHFFLIGIVIQGDGGLLFSLAVLVLISSIGILYLEWQAVLSFLQKIRGR